MEKSLQRRIWEALNQPKGKFELKKYQGICATTGEPINQGVPISEILTEAFSNHGEFLAYGDYVSEWCAWWYSAPKETHRCIVLVGENVYFPTISLNPMIAEKEEDSTKKKRDSYYSLSILKPEDRPSWLDIFRLLSQMPIDTPCGGILTTDPKLRLWPRAELCTVADFGLYIYYPDQSLSRFHRFNLNYCLTICDFIIELLTDGFLKKSIATTLLSDAKKCKKNLSSVLKLESHLKPLREKPEFLPALLVSGVKKSTPSDENKGLF